MATVCSIHTDQQLEKKSASAANVYEYKPQVTEKDHLCLEDTFLERLLDLDKIEKRHSSIPKKIKNKKISIYIYLCFYF